MRRFAPRREQAGTTGSPSTAGFTRRRALLRALVFTVIAALGVATPISAMAVGTAPQANTDRFVLFSSFTYNETWATLMANDTDPEGGPFTLNVISPPNTGAFTTTATGFSYKPDSSFLGTESFKYTITDPQGNVSNVATVLLDVIAYYPLADSYSAVTGIPLIISTTAGVISNDVNPSNVTLSAEVVKTTSHGTLLMDPNGSGGFKYTPDANFMGKDTFTYRLKNTASIPSKNSATVTLDVESPPQAALPVDIRITKVVNGVINTQGSVTVQIKSFTSVKSGAAIDALLAGVVVASGVTDSTGQLVLPIPLPGNAAKYSLQVTEGTLTDSSIIEATPVPVVTGIQITNNPAAIIGKPSTVGVKITSSNTGLAGASVSALIDGKPSGSAMTAPDGTAVIPLQVPATVGNHTLVVFSGNAATSKTLQVSLPAPVVASISLAVPGGKTGQVVNLTTKIASSNAYKAGAAVSVYLDGKKVATKSTDATGTATLPVKLPSFAGKHSIKVVAGTKSAVKTVVLGKGVTAKLTKLKTVKVKKTETIAGSFGTKAAKVTLKITDPKGKSVIKTVTLSSTGKFSYKYKPTKKGSYTVQYSYKANASYYGIKSYKSTFKVK